MAELRPNILIVDNDEEDCLLISEAISESLPTIGSCFLGGGVELLDYLQHCKPNSKDPAAQPCPDLILLDLNMSQIDSREALRMIKADERGRLIPIVILSTSTDLDDINLCYKLGTNSYLTKPLSYNSLVRLMSVLGAYWFSSVQLPVHTGPYFDIVKPLFKTTVLIADYSSFARKYLRDILERAGHTVLTAVDAEETLDIYQRNKPELVIIDYALPQFPGSSIISQLQEIDSKVKIIITTSDTSKIASDDIKNKRVNGILYKPFDSESTLASVDLAMYYKSPDTPSLDSGID